MLKPSVIDPTVMVGKSIYQDCGGARWKLVGDRIDVVAIVPKADLVTHLKTNGMNGTSGAFYAEQHRPGGQRSILAAATNADATARYFRERDKADFVVVGTIVRRGETFPWAIVNLRDVALVCECSEEVDAVEEAKACYYIEASATHPGSNRFVLPIGDVEALRLTTLDALCPLVNCPPPGRAP